MFIDPNHSVFLLEDQFTRCRIELTVEDITYEVFEDKIDTSKDLMGIKVTVPTSTDSRLFKNHFNKEEHLNKPEPLEDDEDYGELFAGAYREGEMMLATFTTVGLADWSKLHIEAYLDSEICPVLDRDDPTCLTYDDQPLKIDLAMDFNAEYRQAVLYY